MTKADELYEELYEEADKVAKQYLAETGNMPSHLNSVLFVLFDRIKKLEEKS